MWTVACQAPLAMEFPRQEYCSGLPFPSPGDLPHPGIEPGSPSLQADSLLSEPLGKPYVYMCGSLTISLDIIPGIFQCIYICTTDIVICIYL